MPRVQLIFDMEIIKQSDDSVVRLVGCETRRCACEATGLLLVGALFVNDAQNLIDYAHIQPPRHYSHHHYHRRHHSRWWP